jgi:hypothetical protein
MKLSQLIEYKMFKCPQGVGTPGDFAEVFILRQLHRVEFVSVVNAGVTEVDLLQNGEIAKIHVDSIGLTEWRVVNRGSADSKGVTERFAWSRGICGARWRGPTAAMPAGRDTAHSDAPKL